MVFRWSESFCVHMVAGEGPRVAPRSNEIPSYASAPIASQLQISAYIGFPLQRADGTLFGTLCAIDPNPQPDSLLAEEQQLSLIAGLLGLILRLEISAADRMRTIEKHQLGGFTDNVTQAYNQRSWEIFLASEESRCSRFGHPAFVALFRLDTLAATRRNIGDAAGDALLWRAAHILRTTSGHSDFVARLDDDTLCVLGVEYGSERASAQMSKLRQALSSSRVTTSDGFATRAPRETLFMAYEKAKADLDALPRKSTIAR